MYHFNIMYAVHGPNVLYLYIKVFLLRLDKDKGQYMYLH